MNRVTHEEVEQMEYLYKTYNYSYTRIGKIINRDPSTVNDHMRGLGYKPKELGSWKRIYPVNHDFFEIIDTEEKAYFLGLMYADGCVVSSISSIIISLKDTDMYVLEKLRDLICLTKPLYIKTKCGGYGEYSAAILQVYSKKLKLDLINLGCSPNKTFTLVFPDTSIVPSELIHHFVRGYFDGDGTITNKSVEIVGNIKFLEGLQNILIDKLNFNKTTIKVTNPTRNTKTRTLRHGGANQCIRFRDWIYKDATVFLTRKKEKLDAIVSNSHSKYSHDPLCIEEGCDAPFFCKGYCQKHYYKHKRTKNEIHREEGTMG